MKAMIERVSLSPILSLIWHEHKLKKILFGLYLSNPTYPIANYIVPLVIFMRTQPHRLMSSLRCICVTSHMYTVLANAIKISGLLPKKKSQVNNLRILNAIGTDLFTSNKNQTLDTFQHYTLQFYSCQGHQVNL